MSGFFDDSHVTDVGLQGSMGRSVGSLDMVQQGYRQQYRVDSQMALDSELETRWKESLRALELAGGGKFSRPDDPLAYRNYARVVNGEAAQVDTPRETSRFGIPVMAGPDPKTSLDEIVKANEAIKALNNPEIKSFEAILQEVAQMQREVEEESSSMYERTGAGGVFGNLIGAMAGSFTARDPLNVVTIPFGAGRTIATRIAVDMGIAGAVVTATEYGDVAPNRALAGLPERDSLFNVAAAALGAGVIRGGIEGIGAGVRAVRGRAEPDIDFDLRDSQLQQMFDAASTSPRARAGASILDDATFIERNNPYGEGHLANVRFIAELQSVQRAMNAEPMTAIARVMPQVPFEYVQKAADFDIVKEQAPQVYARLEETQAKLAQASNIQRFQATIKQDAVDDFIISPASVQAKGEPGFSLDRTYEQDGIITAVFRDEQGNAKGGVLIPLDDEQKAIYGGVITYVDPAYRRQGIATKLYDLAEEQGLPIRELSGTGDLTPQGASFVSARAARKAANAEYQAAYRAVEAEAARLHAQRNAVEAAQQAESSAILASQGLLFTGPLLRYDNVQGLVERINAFNEGLDEATAARFVRETLGEGDNKVEVEVWEKDGGIDIGLRDPVDPNFKFVTDEGEMTVAQAMRDLQEDTDLVEAIKVCAI